MKKSYLVAIFATISAGVVATAAWAASTFHEAHARTFDPAKTRLAQSGWIVGIGCPTGAALDTDGDGKLDATYTDPACATGDSKDDKNEGLLLAKTGPTGNVAAGVAELKDVKGITLTELGYDIRKPGVDQNDPRGSHCGAGAPRFNVVTDDGVTHFVGCNSPAPAVTGSGDGWLRLRWNATALASAFPAISPTDVVKEIAIVFDEGQDTAPDNFGLAVLDNIDVNGTLVGEGNGPSNG